MLQVLEDLRTIWNWILTEKLHINPRDRGLYSAILVLGETFDNRGIFPFIQLNTANGPLAKALFRLQILQKTFLQSCALESVPRARATRFSMQTLQKVFANFVN